MPKEIINITLYPDLRLDYKNSECTINYIYNELEIPDKYKQRIKLERYIPSDIKSIKDFYSLLSLLNEQSGKQSFEITKGKKSTFLLMIILGIPTCIIPPLGLFLLIMGTCGLLGLLKKRIVIPKIKVTSSYSSNKDSEILRKLTELKPVLNVDYDEIYNSVFGITEDDKNKVFENIEFDDGSKLLLFAYSIEPHYEVHWEHETKDGQPDSRYKNNNSYQEISYYSIKLMVPGKIYYYDHVMNFEYEEIIKEIQKLDNKIEIKTIKVAAENNQKLVHKTTNI